MKSTREYAEECWQALQNSEGVRFEVNVSGGIVVQLIKQHMDAAMATLTAERDDYRAARDRALKEWETEANKLIAECDAERARAERAEAAKLDSALQCCTRVKNELSEHLAVADQQLREREAALLAMREVVAHANYLIVSTGNPYHKPLAETGLKESLLALWTAIGITEDAPFSLHPLTAAREALAAVATVAALRKDGR